MRRYSPSSCNSSANQPQSSHARPARTFCWLILVAITAIGPLSFRTGWADEAILPDGSSFQGKLTLADDGRLRFSPAKQRTSMKVDQAEYM